MQQRRNDRQEEDRTFGDQGFNAPAHSPAQAFPKMGSNNGNNAAADGAVGAPRRTQSKQSDAFSGDQLISGGVALFLVGVAVFIWWRGAIFTLLGLKTFGLPLDPDWAFTDLGLAAGQWLIPLMVSVIQWKYWPFKHSWTAPITFKKVKNKYDRYFWIWTSFTMVDIITNIGGVLAWSRLREIIPNTGIIMPSEGLGMWFIAIVLSILLAVVPIKLLLVAADLWFEKFGWVPFSELLGYSTRGKA